MLIHRAYTKLKKKARVNSRDQKKTLPFSGPSVLATDGQPVRPFPITAQNPASVLRRIGNSEKRKSCYFQFFVKTLILRRIALAS